MKIINTNLKDILVSIGMLIISATAYYVIDQSQWLADIILSITNQNLVLWPTLYFGTFALLVAVIILILSNLFNTNILISVLIVGLGGMAWHISDYNYSNISTYVGILGNGFYLLGAIFALLIKIKSNKQFNPDSGADAPPPVN